MNLKRNLLNTATKSPLNTPIKKFLISFFRGAFHFDKMAIFYTKITSKSNKSRQNTIFLILPNVKILSPLARVKMKRAELFSENGDSTRISWSLRKMWNSVSFWSNSFTFIYLRRRVFWKNVLSFQISSALSLLFKCTVFLATVRCFFICCALKIWQQRAENRKGCVLQIKKLWDSSRMLRSV